jgi:hypothetical protein
MCSEGARSSVKGPFGAITVVLVEAAGGGVDVVPLATPDLATVVDVADGVVDEVAALVGVPACGGGVKVAATGSLVGPPRWPRYIPSTRLTTSPTASCHVAHDRFS